MIIDQVDVGVLSTLRGVCLSLRREVQDAFRRRTYGALRQFDIDPPTFLNHLLFTDSIVVGDITLMITFPHQIDTPTLIVIVPQNSFRRFCRAMTNTFNFKLEREAGRVRVFSNKTHFAYVCSTLKQSAIADMGFAPSTAQMSFLSSRGLYLAYPTLTLQKKAISQVCVNRWWIDRNAYMKGIGWIDLQQSLDLWDAFDKHKCMTAWSCPKTLRFLYDGGGLFLALNLGADQQYIYTEKDSVIWGLESKICFSRGGVSVGYSDPTELAMVCHISPYPSHPLMLLQIQTDANDAEGGSDQREDYL